MARLGRLVLALALGAGCAPGEAPAPVGQRQDQVIYGDDDRVDVPAHPDPGWQAVGRDTVVALMSPRVLNLSDPDRVRVRAASLADTQALCPDERFAEQPVAADCSGTLVGPDRVLTAGHCVDEFSCDEIRVVFGWHQREDGGFGAISADDVYRCVEVEAWSLDGAGADLALLRLDRPAEGRTPAAIRFDAEPLPRGFELVMVGYPSGLPAKIEDGGQVVLPGGPARFQATVDAFGGNSGSGVFSAADGRLVGVLVAGQQDYVVDGFCRRVNRLPDGRAPAESLVYPAALLPLLCDDRPDHPLCMPAGEGWCQPCTMDVECPDGWACRLLDGAPGQGSCALPCGSDRDCRGDHRCTAGECAPEVQTACQGDEVWAGDACGLAPRRVEACEPGATCRAGACVAAPEGDTCADARPLGRGSGIRTDLSGYADDTRGACGGAGPDRYHTLRVDERSRLQAEVSGAFGRLSLRASCAQRDELACVTQRSGLDVVLEPGDYVLVQDWDAPQGRASVLSVRLSPLPPDMAAPDMARPEDMAPPTDQAPPPDAGRPDAGPALDAAPVPPRDAAVLVDAGPGPDLAPPGEQPPAQGRPLGGDNEIEWTPRQRPDCSAAPAPGAPGAGWWVALAALGLRRRRRPR